MSTSAITPSILQDPPAIISKAVNAIAHIGTLPEITFKIIELVEAPSSSARDFAKLISNDPALVARILKVVNSAFYGLPGQIGSIDRAIVLLGPNTVRNIVIAASLVRLFRGGRISPHFSARDLWTHSVAVGVMSKLIVGHLHTAPPDEAFVAGLIHDMGILVELQAFGEPLVEIAERALREEIRYIDLETQLIGADHQAFGAGIAAHWKFPQSLQDVAGFHHHPHSLARNCRGLANVVYVADHICCREGLGYSLTCKADALDPTVLSELNLAPEALNTLISALPEAFKETVSLLS